MNRGVLLFVLGCGSASTSTPAKVAPPAPVPSTQAERVDVAPEHQPSTEVAAESDDFGIGGEPSDPNAKSKNVAKCGLTRLRARLSD